jgi:C1A family cysteine protease
LSALAAIATFGLIWHHFHQKSTRDTFLGTDKAAWVAWKQQFSRSYGTNTEEGYRFGNFKANLASINAHNSLGKSWEEGLNQFSDLTFDEFAAQYLKSQPDQSVEMVKSDVLMTSTASTDIPEEFDWRNTGHVVHPVKDQGQCGSCWAFSATGAHESAHAIKEGNSVSLSEQQVVDCDKKDNGCGGGWMNQAFDYIKANGHHDDTFYPYTAQDGTCYYDATKPNLKHMSDYTIVPKHVNDLKAAIKQQPVAVGINGSTIMNYKSGVYSDWMACNFPWPMARINHGVLAVGYGQDYFLIKNSWGSAWGDAGFIKISTYAPSDYINYPVCFTTQKASWPTAA